MRFLILDDERGYGFLLAKTIRRLGHDAVFTCCPDQALRIADAGVDAAILDLRMPGRTGLDVAVDLKRRLPELPVAFAVDAEAPADLVHYARSRGPILPKIWTTDEVQRVVRQLKSIRFPVAAGTRPPSFPGSGPDGGGGAGKAY